MKNKGLHSISFLALAFFGIYVGVFQRLLDEIAQDLSFSRVEMGLTVTIHFMGFFLAALAGELCDRYGRKVVALGSLILFLTGLTVILMSSGFIMLLVGVFFAGAGFGTGEASMTTLLTDEAPQDSNRIINISQVFFGLGAAAGPFVAMLFIGPEGQWKYFYYFGIALTVIFLFFFYKYPYTQYKEVREKADEIISVNLLKQKLFILLLVSIIMYVGMEEGVAFWITSYAKEWSIKEYMPSTMLSAFWLSMVIGRYVNSKFSRRLNELLMICSSIALIFLATSIFSGNPVVIISSFFGLGFVISGIWPMLLALARAYYPESSGTALGIMMSGGAVGGIVIPLVMGYIGSSANMKYALAFCIVPASVIMLNHFIIQSGRIKGLQLVKKGLRIKE